MEYLIKVPRIQKNSSLDITNIENEVAGVVTINGKKMSIKNTNTNEEFQVVSNPLKLKNRFVIMKNDQVEARIHIGKKIIHSIIEHGEYCFVKSALFQYKYKVYLNRDVIGTLDLVKIEKERFYKIESKNDDFVMVIALFLLARAVRFKAILN